MQSGKSIFFWYLNKTRILVYDFLYSTETDKEIIEVKSRLKLSTG